MTNEAKTTKAYKVSTDLKEKLESLFIDSGMDTQEAFIEHIATLYELQLMKEGSAVGYKKQLDELEYHIRRPMELFLGMIQTEAADRFQLSQRHEEVNADRAATIFAQEQENMELRKEVKVKTDELVRLTKESEAQIKLIEQLEAAAHDKGLLVEEYRQRIDTLSGLVNEYKAAAEENKNLQTQITELTKLSEQAEVQVAILKGDISSLEASKVEQLKQADERHREALERLSERKDTERERAELAIQKEYQAKLEKANEDATGKIRELYEQIERLRSLHERQVYEIQQQKENGKTPPETK